MKNYQNSIRKSQQLQYAADISKKTSIIVKNPPPIEEEIKSPIIEKPIQKTEQPTVEEKPTTLEPVIEQIKTETTGSITITKNKING